MLSTPTDPHFVNDVESKPKHLFGDFLCRVSINKEGVERLESWAHLMVSRPILVCTLCAVKK
jgi:hypothetical protein